LHAAQFRAVGVIERQHNRFAVFEEIADPSQIVFVISVGDVQIDEVALFGNNTGADFDIRFLVDTVRVFNRVDLLFNLCRCDRA